MPSGLFEKGERAIRAAIIHKNDFVRAAWNRIQNAAQTFEQLRQNGFFIVNGDCHGQAEFIGHRFAAAYSWIRTRGTGPYYSTCLHDSWVRTQGTNRPATFHSGAYRLLREQVLERDGWRCQMCGSFKNLQAHHIESRSQLGNDSE